MRIFNPLHVLDNKISLSDIDGLKIFKFYEPLRLLFRLIKMMKTGVKKYQALANLMKSVEARKDSKGKDNFDMSDWWK